MVRGDVGLQGGSRPRRVQKDTNEYQMEHQTEPQTGPGTDPGQKLRKNDVKIDPKGKWPEMTQKWRKDGPRRKMTRNEAQSKMTRNDAKSKKNSRASREKKKIRCDNFPNVKFPQRKISRCQISQT